MKKRAMLGFLLGFFWVNCLAQSYYLACVNEHDNANWAWSGPVLDEMWEKFGFIQTYGGSTLLLGEYYSSSDPRGPGHPVFHLNVRFRSKGEATNFCQTLKKQCMEQTGLGYAGISYTLSPDNVIPISFWIYDISQSPRESQLACDEVA